MSVQMRNDWALPAIWLATGAVTLFSGDAMMAAVWFLLGAGLLPMNLIEGSRRKRWFQMGVGIAAVIIMGLVIVRDVQAQGSETYTEPEGRWSLPLPTGWLVEEFDGYVALNAPEGDLNIYILVDESDDYAQIAADGWALVQPEFDLTYTEDDVLEIDDPVLLEGYDYGYIITYADGTGADGRYTQAAMSLLGDTTYTFLIDTNVPALQRRLAQFQTLATGFLPTDMAQTDLSGTEIMAFDDAFFETLTAFAEESRTALDVNAVAFAVVSGGEVVYSTGLGADITADTRMMIGSITKTMTTMLMAQAVDEGAFGWETPVTEIDPNFSVADPDISAQLTMADLVCACTGVPRRDYELIYNSGLGADDIFAQLRDFPFFTAVGEAFQYSNQLVAAGGYETARALNPDASDLLAAYDAELQARILAPVGMTRTTLDFDAVQADSDHAIPYGTNIESVIYPLTVEDERFLLSVAPAGAIWSTANDMGRYLATVAADGVTPDGERIVSAENFARTQQPGIEINATTRYGLGWILSEYKGVPVRMHDGATLGFSTSMAYFPDSGAGIIVMVNQQGSPVASLVTQRFFELALGETENAAADTLTYIVSENADDEDAPEFVKTLDADFIAPYLGTFANDLLGTVTLAQDADGTVTYDSGEFVTEIWGVTDEASGETRYVLAEPPLKGDPVRFALSDDGTATISIGFGLNEYVFTRVD